MLEQLKEQLNNILKGYEHHDYCVVLDKDIINFENLIIDFDNENNTDYYSSFMEVVQVADFDIIQDVIKSNLGSVEELSDMLDDIEYNSAEFFKFNDYGCLSNVYAIDLMDWVNDYLK